MQKARHSRAYFVRVWTVCLIAAIWTIQILIWMYRKVSQNYLYALISLLLVHMELTAITFKWFIHALTTGTFEMFIRFAITNGFITTTIITMFKTYKINENISFLSLLYFWPKLNMARFAEYMSLLFTAELDISE